MAVACINIELTSEYHIAERATMTDVAVKVTNFILDSLWAPPRKFGLIQPNIFALVDPNATNLDPLELHNLVRSIQDKLFGRGDGGQVTLFTFDGDQAEVTRAAKSPQEIFSKLLQNDSGG